MTDPPEQKVTFTVTNGPFSIDIGADGGKLEWHTMEPVGEMTDFKINGEPATPEQVDRWIFHWHELRDSVTCVCQWCARHRERTP